MSYTLPDWCLHHFCLSDRYSGNFCYEDFVLLFIELLEFNKQQEELASDLNRWLYVLKHISTLENFLYFLNKPVFQWLVDIAAYVNFSKNEKAMYDIDLRLSRMRRGQDCYSFWFGMRTEGKASIRDRNCCSGGFSESSAEKALKCVFAAILY